MEIKFTGMVKQFILQDSQLADLVELFNNQFYSDYYVVFLRQVLLLFLLEQYGSLIENWTIKFVLCTEFVIRFNKHNFMSKWSWFVSTIFYEGMSRFLENPVWLHPGVAISSKIYYRFQHRTSWHLVSDYRFGHASLWLPRRQYHAGESSLSSGSRSNARFIVKCVI